MVLRQFPLAGGRIELTASQHGMMLKISTAEALTVMPVTRAELRELGHAFIAAGDGEEAAHYGAPQ